MWDTLHRRKEAKDREYSYSQWSKLAAKLDNEFLTTKQRDVILV